MDSRMTSKKRKAGQNSIRMYRVGAIALLLFVVAGLFMALFAGAVFARDVLFINNDRFLIKTIEVVDGQIKTEEMIREYLSYEGIDIGTNLFSFDLSDFEKMYLERNPLIRMVQVTRLLPDTLKVVIQERDPLVRLGQRGTLVADSEGFVFRLSSKLHRLPVIIGCKDPQLAPGTYVREMTMCAVEVLAFCDNPRVGVRVVGIDVGNRDYLLLHVSLLP
jgi:cell division septal protein FtsQ